MNFSHSICMSLTTLHTPLEIVTIFILFTQVFFNLTVVLKLNLIATTGIFIILKILEYPLISSKTNFWSTLNSKNPVLLQMKCLTSGSKVGIRPKAQFLPTLKWIKIKPPCIRLCYRSTRVLANCLWWFHTEYDFYWFIFFSKLRLFARKSLFSHFFE